MLTIFQRLLLGGLLLVTLVAGLALAVRHTFVSISALDGQGKQMDRAVATLAAARAALAREQILVERSLLRFPAAPATGEAAGSALAVTPSTREIDVHGQAVRAEERLLAARSAMRGLSDAPTLDAELDAHGRVLARMQHAPPELDASAKALEPIDESLSRKLVDLEDRRRRLEADLQLKREGLGARLIAACGASFLSAIAVVVAMLVWTTRPLRKAARAARRMGQGDLQQRSTGRATMNWARWQPSSTAWRFACATCATRKAVAARWTGR